MALAAYLVYETRVRRTLDSRQGDATINEQENSQRAGEEPRGSKRAGLTRHVGIVLLVAAVLFWVAVPTVLLTRLSAAQKAWTSTTFLVLEEGGFWVVALGREVFRRYKRFLDPLGWFGKVRR